MNTTNTKQDKILKYGDFIIGILYNIYNPSNVLHIKAPVLYLGREETFVGREVVFKNLETFFSFRENRKRFLTQDDFTRGFYGKEL